MLSARLLFLIVLLGLAGCQLTEPGLKELPNWQEPSADGDDPEHHRPYGVI